MNTLVEIGVHHGKSLVETAKCGQFKRLVAIDLFRNQRENVDKSGSGNLNIVSESLKFYNLSSITKIVSANSQKITHENMLSYTDSHSVDFFSVDGCHTSFCTLNDLKLAFGVLSKTGIVMIDDPFRLDWPGVTLGVGMFMHLRDDVSIFAYGYNKVFMCFKDQFSRYQREAEKLCKGIGTTCKTKIGLNGMRDKVVRFSGISFDREKSKNSTCIAEAKFTPKLSTK
jgi:hypothetical protein